MQELEHTLMAALPLSWLAQATRTFLDTGTSAIRWRGQALAQAMQSVHLSGSTTAAPLGPMDMAPNWQAATQEPKPRQPNWHSRGPAATLVAEMQSFTPMYSYRLTALAPPLQRTKATFRSPEGAAAPMMAAMAAWFSAPAGAQAFTGASPARMAAAQPEQPG